MAAKAKAAKNDTSRCPVYVIHGKDRRRVTDSADAIARQVLADADPQLSLSRLEGNNIELADVLDELRTLPFLSPCRLVMIKDADSFITKYRQPLEAYLEAPSPTGVLILLPESFPATTRLAKIAAKIGQVISCEPIKPKELARYLITYAKEQYGLKLNQEAAELLRELAGDDSGILCCEVDKIAAYLAGPDNPKTEITLNDVQAVVGHNRLYNVFHVIDALTAGKTAEALSLLNHMLNQDRDAQYTAVGAFAWHFRRLYQARILLDKKLSEGEIIRQSRIWANQEQFMQQVKKLKIEQLGSILEQLMRIDQASKTGAGSVRTGLEKLIVQFSTGKRRAV